MREGVEVRKRLAGLAVALLPVMPSGVEAQTVTVPPDTVSTVYVTDTLAGYGALGGLGNGSVPGSVS